MVTSGSETVMVYDEQEIRPEPQFLREQPPERRLFSDKTKHQGKFEDTHS